MIDTEALSNLHAMQEMFIDGLLAITQNSLASFVHVITVYIVAKKIVSEVYYIHKIGRREKCIDDFNNDILKQEKQDKEQMRELEKLI